ncbi:MAG: putative Ig domain-containing protein, partial [Nanoarchaeota archaeon]|nr:putative Ig domain-containing protein [Nanoarchaeota archaeon]
NRDFDGEDSFTFKANDGKSNSNIAKISMVVNGINTPTNHAPVITSTPVTSVNESSAYTYQVTATDTDEDALTYSIIQGPGWLSINQNTGKVTGTAQDVNKDSSWKVIIKVSDSKGFVTQSYILTVKDVPAIIPTNHAPVITSTPITEVNEDSSYTYQVVATDADGDTLTYSLTRNPVWLSIDSATGLITGTAPDVTEDTYVPIEILVSDGEDSTTQTYSIKVVNIEEDSGDNTIILGGKKDKERPTSLIQFDEFYTNKYLDQFSHITLDEQETDQEDTTGSNLKNILFVLASLMAIVIILGLVTILFRRL